MKTKLALALAALLPAQIVLAQDKPADAPLDAAKLSKVPKQKKFVEADYPPDAFAKGIEAEVILLLDIDEKGYVTAVGIQTPATPAGMGFDEAAAVAAGSWEFEPAELDGKPIAVQISYRYRFTIKPKEAPAPATQPTAPASQPTVEPPAAPARQPVVNFSGVLVERGTRTPMPGVLVTVFRDDVDPPVGFEATTDDTGRFEFFDLAQASWKVLVEAPGYFPYRTSEDISTTERLDVTYHVEKGSYNPYDVTVTAQRPRKEVSRTIIKAAEIDKVPGGAGDPLTVIQNFAGVARTGSPAQLVIRGSAPEDSRVFIDGIEVPLLYHFGGLKSVLPIGVLESIEFYPGNFSPVYGRATGGIIDVRIKDLKPEKMTGYADVSILDTGVYLEIPIGKNAAIALAGRRSYIDVILNAVVPDDAGVSLQTAPVYYDYQLVGSYRPKPAHNFRLFVFGSDDRLKILFQNPADVDTELEGDTFSNVTTFQRAIGEYRYVPSKTFENSLKISAGRDNLLFSAGQLRFDLDIQTLQLRDVARWEFGDMFALSAGFDGALAVADAFVRLPRPPKEGEPQTDFDIGELIVSDNGTDYVWSPAVFAEGEITPVEGLLLLPGLRVDYFDLVQEAHVQPRFTARYQLDPSWVVKGGAGLFVQEPTFEEVDESFGNPELGVEQALHYSVGAEYKPFEWLTIDGTLFYKDMWDLVSRSDKLIERDGMTVPETYDNGGTGQVYGLELQARHDLAHNLTGWVAYTLSRAERIDSGETESRLFDFDQTHILTVVGNYLLPRNWQVGLRYRVVSGNPTTPVIGSTYNASEDEYKPIYGETNSARLGTFHQLDLRLDKRWIYQNWILNAYVDIQNVYDAANPEQTSYNFDYSESSTNTGVPIITIIGLRGEF